MKLKKKIDQAAFDALAEAVREAYTKAADGSYLLDAEADDNSKLTTALESERTLRKDLEKKVAAFGDLDPEEIRAIINRFSGDEEQQMLKQGKSLDDIFKKRTEKLQQAHAKEIEKLTNELSASKGVASKYTQKVLDNDLREAVSAAKGFPDAMDDFLLRGRQVFKLDDEGKVVALDSDGNVVFGKDGKTPLSPVEWAGGLRETAPHLFPANSGGGTPGQKSQQHSGKTMSRATFDALPAKERNAVMSDGKTRVID